MVGVMIIVAATRDGSRGKTADLLFIDELRSTTLDAWTASRPILELEKTRRRWLHQTPEMPLVKSLMICAKERYLTLRLRLHGMNIRLHKVVIYWDKKFWYMANPALGWTITEDVIAEAVATNPVEATRTEVLCSWMPIRLLVLGLSA
jgi:hypothetical protein